MLDVVVSAGCCVMPGALPEAQPWVRIPGTAWSLGLGYFLGSRVLVDTRTRRNLKVSFNAAGLQRECIYDISAKKFPCYVMELPFCITFKHAVGYAFSQTFIEA